MGHQIMFHYFQAHPPPDESHSEPESEEGEEEEVEGDIVEDFQFSSSEEDSS